MHIKTLLATPLLFISCAAFSQSNTIGSGIALQFNGSANYIDIGDVYNSINFPFTFETWLYLPSYPAGAGELFTTDNNLPRYYGTFITVGNDGTVDCEFGDGVGAGVSNRRGRKTTDALPLNKWVHLAVVFNSISDADFYYNGVLMTNVASSGSSAITNQVHSTGHAFIGASISTGSTYLNATLDEIRFWNIARAQTDIQTYMCRKLTGSETGLIGYWKADESYTSSTVNDYSPSIYNGTIVGTVTKPSSGAPIGDASKFDYTTDWSGVTLSLNSSGGDLFKVNKILNTPLGVQIYRVNHSPYYSTGLSANPNFYYGVFTIDNATAALYTVNYTYAFTDGVEDATNEAYTSLFKKSDGSATTWSTAGATLNTAANKLTRKNIGVRYEFILDNDSTNLRTSQNDQLANLYSKLNVFPNPFSDHITLQNEGLNWEHIYITNEMGQQIYSAIPGAYQNTVSIATSDWADGLYFILIKTDSGVISRKVILDK